MYSMTQIKINKISTFIKKKKDLSYLKKLKNLYINIISTYSFQKKYKIKNETRFHLKIKLICYKKSIYLKK